MTGTAKIRYALVVSLQYRSSTKVDQFGEYVLRLDRGGGDFRREVKDIKIKTRGVIKYSMARHVQEEKNAGETTN